jgi:hypothetical protein
MVQPKRCRISPKIIRQSHFSTCTRKPAHHLTHIQERSLSMWLGVSNGHHGCLIIASGGKCEFAPFVVSQQIPVFGYRRLHYELRDINTKYAKWAILGRGMNYFMPFCIRFDVKKWRDHMDSILSTATVNLLVSENSRASVMSMIGSTSLDCSAPLGFPRSASLRLAGDGQSLSVDFDIRQSGRDQVSSLLPYDRMTPQPGLKGF